jgi:hypothetical protein
MTDKRDGAESSDDPIPDFAEWSHDRRAALYEMAGNYATMTKVAKWGLTVLAVLTGFMTFIYYALSIRNLYKPH